jgi:hypothetical protein
MDEYDAPVASARARTSRLKSLLLVIVASVLCSPPQQSNKVGRWTTRRGSAPLCLPSGSAGRADEGLA